MTTTELLGKWSDEAWEEELQTAREEWAEYEDNKVDWESYFASQTPKGELK